MTGDNPASLPPPDGCRTEMSGLKVPRALSDITPHWLRAALCANREAGGPSVSGYSAETIAEGKGFMSQLFRLRLDHDAGSPDMPPTVIAKLPSTDPMLRTVFDGLGQNRREVLFYRELANGSVLRTPRSYFCGQDPETGDTALLLEDLSYLRQGDSVAGCTVEEARRCIEQLARFHASWWGSPLLERLDWMPLREAEAGVYQEIYAGAWSALIEKAGDGMPPTLRLLGDRLNSEVSGIKARLSKPPRTVVHGDYRLDNCFLPEGSDPQPVVVFDWEFCVRGRGAYDVATFVSEAFPSQQRREVELDLLREYHSLLEDCGVRDYPFEECLYDYRLSMLEVFVFWITTGGYCDYQDGRARVYLRNTLERLDAAIADLASTETIGLLSGS